VIALGIFLGLSDSNKHISRREELIGEFQGINNVGNAPGLLQIANVIA